MTQALAISSLTELPAPLVAMQELYGITLAETERVQLIVVEYSTNLATIDKLLDRGLSVIEIEQVYEARERINDSLGKAELTQAVSLTALVRFQTAFRSEALDADSLVQRVIAIQDRFQHQYLSAVLTQLSQFGVSDPDYLPESLCDLLSGESDLDVELTEED